MMLNSRVFTIPIRRSYEEVYGFLSAPENFVLWGGANPGSQMQHIAGADYLVDLPRGRLVMRFSPVNKYGVLDYQVFPQGADSGPVTPVRLYANQEGCEMVFTWYRREGVSDEQFASDAEWALSDLLRMKAYIEGR
jgi:hypothetical protein